MASTELAGAVGRCPLCGAELAARAEVGRRGETVIAARCPEEGAFVLEGDLVAALPGLAPERVAATRDYLRALRLVTDEPQSLSLALVACL
ncbi:MAG: hypothetical protein CVU56_10520 [Deltaproteobacteria bacterium HGW-Deltaproteobacteria-14]|jgi:hypothetical protein|nr:MAG: hypothetical protein CVU56_10520 [Deltaproteobacteria bacterium HGW-Deltaproteobacteria-14]